jgi:Tfp pilus assembly protein PilF
MNKANAKTYYHAGVRFLKEDRFLEAINALTKAIQFDPKLWDAFLVRGMAYGKKGDDEKAIEDFNIYIKYVKDEPSAFLFR